MAVYKKTYSRYEGALTAEWSRFFVLTRYSLAEMNRSRFLTLFFLGTLLYPLICALIIYLHHNLGALAVLQVNPAKLIAINARFFLAFLGVQSMLAFLLTSFIGPGLISPDLANNALPLYLSRPFSRTEYVLGRIGVLLVLLSAITWIPGLLLFLMQGYLAEDGWMVDNARIASGLVLGAWIWIAVLSLMALALSAWVKWKPVAGGLIWGLFFVAAGFGAAINEVLRTDWGSLINVSHLIGSVWVSLFGEPMQRGAGAVFFRVTRDEVPIWTCWVALLSLCAVCLWLLAKKIRGAEVVR